MRNQYGQTSQEKAADWMLNRFNVNNNLMTLSSISPIGSKKDDIVLKMSDGTSLSVEVKSILTQEVITLVDKQVYRDKVSPEIEQIYSRYSTNLVVGGMQLKKAMIASGIPDNFVGMIDFFKANFDSKVGFSGDPGVTKSGKMPKETRTNNTELLSKFRDDYKKSLVKKKVSVLCLVRNDGVECYHTGYSKNPLGLSRLPSFREVLLTTYGSTSNKSTRIALKASL